MDSLLERAFELSTDPQDMARHFWEFIGYMLKPPKAGKYKWILTGGPDSLRQQVLTVASSIILYSETIQNVGPAMTIATATKAHNQKTMRIPFYPSFTTTKSDPYEMDRLRRVIKRGGFQEPADCKKAPKADHIDRFIDERCVIFESHKIKTPLAEIYNEYTQWACTQEKTLRRKHLILGLQARGIPYTPYGKRHFSGIALKAY
jgi:hypothetical protein